jgi:hypothetical protein
VYDRGGMCSRQQFDANAWRVPCLVVLCLGLGCARGPLKAGSKDAGTPDRTALADVPLSTDEASETRDVGVPDELSDLAAEARESAAELPNLAAEARESAAEVQDSALAVRDSGPEAQDMAVDARPSEAGTVDAAGGVDACIPIGCHDSICDLDYCGKIGDGCGGTLDCGMACRAGQLCNTARGTCMGDWSCVSLTCDIGTPGNYCGDIGDGCLGVLHCPTDCNLAGWTCENHICVGRPPACEFRTCDTPAEQRCGKIADGCGGILDCGLQCAQPGWLCSAAHGRCVGGKDCVPVSCDGPAGEQYCGTIGDGCGGSLECTRTCSGSGLSCRDNLCVETAGCPKVNCVLADGGHYCGVIGDGCGGAQDCGVTCPDGSVCGGVRPNECGTGTSSPPLAAPKLPLLAPPPPVPGWPPLATPPPPSLCLPPPPAPQP